MNQPVRVLMIEGNETDACLFSDAMRNKGMKVHHAITAQNGYRAIAEDGPFDVIVVDVELPDSSNGKTMSELSARAPGVPIIILTSVDDEDMMQHLLACGAEKYLVKSEITPLHVCRMIKCVAIRRSALQNNDSQFQNAIDKMDTSIAGMKRAAALEHQR